MARQPIMTDPCTSKKSILGSSLFTEQNIAEEGTRTVGIYARTSSPNQRYNYSIDEQVNKCWEYCERRGWTIRHVFVDECQSAKNTERVNFQQLMKTVERGEFDAIVFWKLDRFCRSLADLVSIEKILRQRGVGLCSITEFIDTTTSVGRFNYRNLASVAELEREMIGERARLGLYGMARESKWPNPHPPLGYDIDKDNKLTINEAEAKTVTRIFRTYTSSKSMPQVAFELNREGVATKACGKWNARAVRDILSNPIYSGHYVVAGVDKQVEDYRIVTDELLGEAKNTTLGHDANKTPMPLDRKQAKLDALLTSYSEFLRHYHSNSKEQEATVGDLGSACAHLQQTKWTDDRIACKSCGLVLSNRKQEAPVAIQETVTTNRPPIRRASRCMENQISVEDWLEHCRVSDQTESNFAFALAEITAIGNHLTIPVENFEKAASLMKTVFLNRMTKGRSIKAFCGAAVYVACRESGLTRFWYEIANASEIPENEVLHSYRILTRELGIASLTPRIEEYVQRILKLLRIDERRAADALARTRSLGCGSSMKSPPGVAAAFTYVALAGLGLKRTQKEIAIAAGVTEATIRKRCGDFQVAAGFSASGYCDLSAQVRYVEFPHK